MRVISLGWGCQSFALAAMSALGELPPVDAAIHADTTHERSDTYAFAEKWTPWLEARGVRVVTVRADASTTNVVNEQRGYTFMPVRLTSDAGERAGMLHRQCTDRWKVRPIHRWLQAHRNGAQVEQWLGITLDEVQRMKPAQVKYIDNRWPLIEQRMSRHDVIRWLESHNLEIPPKSACVFCPYHDLDQWREIHDIGNGDWTRALEVDGAIRDLRPGYRAYLTREMVPLADLDLRTEADHGQLSLWDDECDGYCGV